jgi:hypothetical protein
MPSFHQSHLLTVGNKKMAAFDGRATPLLWADGISRVADLELYKRTGLNVVVVHLGWRPSEDGTVNLDDLQGPRGFANAAAALGLQVVYSLPPAPAGFERSLRPTGDSEPYFLIWSTWVNSAVVALRDTPNLLGWMLPNDPRALPYADDIGFGRWIAANFASVEILNRQWETQFTSLEDVTLQTANALVEDWRGPPSLEDARNNAELQSRVERLTRRKPNPNFVFHPAGLAMAQFRREAYRGLIGRWTQIIKEADPLHFVMSGRLPDYAQLLALTPDIDISVPDLQPDIAESDLATHNPQAIDIARRGGRFAATPVLTTTPSRNMPEHILPVAMPTWIRAAIAHGASGLVFSSWPDLVNNEPLRKAIETTLAEISSGPTQALWNAAPVSTSAVVLTPLADGHTLQVTRNPMTGEPLGEPRGLYGFGDDLVRGEPSNLVWALRWGTAFGSVDYLAPEDLNDGNLDRYGTLLMPQALTLGADSIDAVGRFVSQGGVAVTDLGVGAAQAGWQVLGIPPRLSELFGISPPRSVTTASFNLQGFTGHPLFPTFSSSRAPNGSGAVLSAGDGPFGTAFSGPVAFSLALKGTVPVGLAQRLAGTNGAFDAFLTIRPLGEGFAVYAPFRLWSTWRPGHHGFAQFHGDLLARGAALVQLDARAFVPSPGGEVNNGFPLYPQMINYRSAIALFNHSPQRGPVNRPQTAPDAALPPGLPPGLAPQGQGSSPDATPGDRAPAPTAPDDWQYSTIQTPGVGEFLWSNAMCMFPVNGDVSPDAPRRPAPATVVDALASRPRLVTLYAAVKAQTMNFARLLPITTQNLAGGSILASVAKYDNTGIKMTVWPNSEGVIPNSGQFNVILGQKGPARVTVYGGADAYKVAPNSTHRVTITDHGTPAPDPKSKAKPPVSPVTTQVLTADADGHLQIELSTRVAIIEITPV